MEEFLTDVKTLRERARENIEKGPVTDAYGADLERVIYVLNQALATELVCVLRYKRHYFTADGLDAQAAADEFLEHDGQQKKGTRKRGVHDQREIHPPRHDGLRSQWSRRDDLPHRTQRTHAIYRCSSRQFGDARLL